MGLPRENRLKHRREFQKVYQKGIHRQTTHLTLRALLDLEKTAASEAGEKILPPTKVGISIARKVSKKAVIRNRIKRQIKAIIRQMLPDISPGWKIIIIVRSSAVKCEYKDFLRELKQLLVKAEIIDGY